MGSAARLVGILGTLVVLWAGVQVGRAGGELVYEHGAASAYLDGTASPEAGVPSADGDRGEEDEHDGG